MEQRVLRCDPNDPRRCEAIVSEGQCPYLSLEGYKFCRMHGGTFINAGEKESIRNYQLAKWQARVNKFADNDKVKNLREEIGILRMSLEAIVLKCQDESDLVIYSGKISDLVMKIEKVVSSCHRLELSTGALLDKTAVLQIAGTIVEIVSRHVQGIEEISSITEEIMASVAEIKITDPIALGRKNCV